jgi:hypothetical protein
MHKEFFSKKKLFVKVERNKMSISTSVFSLHICMYAAKIQRGVKGKGRKDTIVAFYFRGSSDVHITTGSITFN